MRTETTPRVSVIMPCYNAEQWVEGAIESVLAQTHPAVELIVVDDGSRDGSLQIIRRYGDRIRCETGPNRGGSHARNRGIALSTGDYIQFLDADDYLLPEKLEQQVGFLESTHSDVVYGDWQYRYDLPDAATHFGEVVCPDEQQDVLEALLGGWWVACHALLFRREVVLKAGGWDTTLTAAQDRDFFTSVALGGADIRYQPGCHAIYRRYGNTTVSTGNLERWLTNHWRVLEKAEARLRAEQRLTPHYANALARSYFHLARNYYERDRQKYRQAMGKVHALAPGFRPAESRVYNLVQKWGGYELAEWTACAKRRLGNQVSRIAKARK